MAQPARANRARAMDTRFSTCERGRHSCGYGCALEMHTVVQATDILGSWCAWVCSEQWVGGLVNHLIDIDCGGQWIHGTGGTWVGTAGVHGWVQEQWVNGLNNWFVLSAIIQCAGGYRSNGLATYGAHCACMCDACTAPADGTSPPCHCKPIAFLSVSKLFGTKSSHPCHSMVKQQVVLEKLTFWHEVYSFHSFHVLRGLRGYLRARVHMCNNKEVAIHKPVPRQQAPLKLSS